MRYKCVSDERQLGIPRICELIQQWLGLISAWVCATDFTYLMCDLHQDAASVYRCLCEEMRPRARRGLQENTDFVLSPLRCAVSAIIYLLS